MKKLSTQELIDKGATLGRQGEDLRAEKYFLEVLKRKPTHKLATGNLALVYKNTGRLKQAEQLYKKLIARYPDEAQYYSFIGNVYYELGELKEAEGNYKKATKLEYNNADYFCNLGICQADLSKFKSALKNLFRAVELNDKLAEAYYNIGYIFQHNRDTKRALIYFGQAIRYKPDLNMAYPHMYFMLRYLCDWKLMKDFNKKLDILLEDSLQKNELPVETGFINFVRCEDLNTNYLVGKAWSRDVEIKIKKYKPLMPKKQNWHNNRIRIGYVSDAFYDFPTAHNVTDVFRSHDKNKFEIYTYSHGASDESYWRRQIKKATKFCNVKQLSDLEVAKKIHKDKIDILVDLKGHSKGGRLGIFALKPAKVNVAWLGYPATTGADFIGYMIVDKTMVKKGEEKYYSEKLMYMPNSYRPPDTSTKVKKSKQLTRAKYKLPKSKFVFCSFNSDYKHDPTTWKVWMRILKKVPKSVLWIISKNETTRNNLWSEAKRLGVSKAQIIFAGRLPKSKHLARLPLADLALDTHPVNGHTTTTDCLRMGVPVITMYGKHFASRVSTSCLRAIGLPELVAKNWSEYERLAVSLAKDSVMIKELKNKLASNIKTKPLFDVMDFTSDLESCYKRILGN